MRKIEITIRDVHKAVFGPITVSSADEVVIDQIKEFMKTVNLDEFLEEIFTEATKEYLSGLL